MLIDTHCHLADPAFEADREAVLVRSRAAGVRHVVILGETPERATSALALTTDPVIDPGDLLLPETPGGTDERELSGDLPTLDELEARYIMRVLAFTKGNMSKAAKILGVDRKTLYRKRDELSQNAPDCSVQSPALPR